MNKFRQEYLFIKLSDILALLGDKFHLYEQHAIVSHGECYPKDAYTSRTHDRIYAQHITKLDIEETGYYKDLWFQMYVHTKNNKDYTIYDDNVDFQNKDIKNMKVSANPYISPMFVMRDAMSYMNEEDKKLAEMIKMNDKLLNWLHYMKVKDEDLEKYYIRYEYNKTYQYNLPNIELDYTSQTFRGYKDGKLELTTYEINEIIKDIKNPALKTKTEYLLKALGNNDKHREREVYDYD